MRFRSVNSSHEPKHSPKAKSQFPSVHLLYSARPLKIPSPLIHYGSDMALGGMYKWQSQSEWILEQRVLNEMKKRK